MITQETTLKTNMVEQAKAVYDMGTPYQAQYTGWLIG